MFRLFIAIDLPSPLQQQLGSMAFGIPGARWVDPGQLHLTLTFIGEVDGLVFQDIRRMLAEIDAPGFTLQLKGTGHFPPRGAPRVLWVGLEHNEMLLQLKKRIDAGLVRVGVRLEERKFAPHITLARLKNTPPARIGNFLAGNGLFESPPFRVTEFLLYSSRLTQKGAIHTIEQKYPLKGTENSKPKSER